MLVKVFEITNDRILSVDENKILKIKFVEFSRERPDVNLITAKGGKVATDEEVENVLDNYFNKMDMNKLLKLSVMLATYFN